MDNTTLGSMAFGFDHTLMILDMVTAKYRKYPASVFAPKGTLFVTGVALKYRFIRRHDLFQSSTFQIGGISSS